MPSEQELLEQAMAEKERRRRQDRTARNQGAEQVSRRQPRRDPDTLVQGDVQQPYRENGQDEGFWSRLGQALYGFGSDVYETGSELAGGDVSQLAGLGAGVPKGAYRGLRGAVEPLGIDLPEMGDITGTAGERVGTGIGQGAAAALPYTQLLKLGRYAPAAISKLPQALQTALKTGGKATAGAVSAGATEPEQRDIAAFMGGVTPAAGRGAGAVKKGTGRRFQALDPQVRNQKFAEAVRQKAGKLQKPIQQGFEDFYEQTAEETFGGAEKETTKPVDIDNVATDQLMDLYQQGGAMPPKMRDTVENYVDNPSIQNTHKLMQDLYARGKKLKDSDYQYEVDLGDDMLALRKKLREKIPQTLKKHGHEDLANQFEGLMSEYSQNIGPLHNTPYMRKLIFGTKEGEWEAPNNLLGKMEKGTGSAHERYRALFEDELKQAQKREKFPRRAETAKKLAGYLTGAEALKHIFRNMF